uniref:Secreted protein n=1 Tax=Rhizophora mucronata TaxID=61149 RepID=A0A2P2KF84_RHIMU
MIISNIFTRILFASVFLPSFSSAARKEVTKQQRQCLAWQQACSLLIKQWDISWPFGFHSSDNVSHAWFRGWSTFCTYRLLPGA